MAHRTTKFAYAAFAAIIIITALSGCYYDVESELYPGQNCDTPPNVTYTDHIAPFLTQNCALSGCHVTGGNAPGNFETYDGVLEKVNNGSFENVTVISRSMPPSGPLPNCEIQLIETWLAQGAPQ